MAETNGDTFHSQGGQNSAAARWLPFLRVSVTNTRILEQAFTLVRSLAPSRVGTWQLPDDDRQQYYGLNQAKPVVLLQKPYL
ncbi:hypothetical protein LGH70_02555 [Hymenobacter sp. BT635]|uniref:Uncharacterized protein n=1 Tax=Hymenobacter nitidus TaxID=2880929 RepID=A0ABS8AAK9_9BACT|nr:hypothetical protein [Hymenobacter nitidus]MCB2376444.1 hypothetical protein [Hymenobacter nitidus]